MSLSEALANHHHVDPSQSLVREFKELNVVVMALKNDWSRDVSEPLNGITLEYLASITYNT
jgi:hypothetical protein